MLLPKMIFNNLSPEDNYGLQVIKDGYNPIRDRQEARNRNKNEKVD